MVTTKLIWTYSSRLACKMFSIIKQLKLSLLLVNAVLKNRHLLLKMSGRILYAVRLAILLITFSPITTDTVAHLLRPVALKLFSGLFLTSHLQVSLFEFFTKIKLNFIVNKKTVEMMASMSDDTDFENNWRNTQPMNGRTLDYYHPYEEVEMSSATTTSLSCATLAFVYGQL